MEEADMAPPHKRRRLADTPSQLSASFSQLTLSRPTPTLSHTVEQLEHRPTLARIPRPVPQRIEEVHFQIQKRAFADHHEHHHQALQRRQQGTAVSSALDSTLTVTVLQWADPAGATALSTINDDLGGTYATTQTLTLVSSPLPSATSTPSSTEATPTGSSDGAPSDTASPSPSEGYIGMNPSGTGSGTGATSTQASGTGSVTSTPPSSTGTGLTAASISGSSATNTNSTQTDRTQSSGSSGASLGPGVFLATLSNGDVIALTRSDEAYATTFADGRVTTISPSQSRSSDRSSQSRISTDTSDRSSRQQQSTATSVNIVTEPNQTQNSPPTPTAASIASSSSASGGGGGSGTTAPPGTIAGGVVGGCAGLAVILLVALVLLRWWKRKAQNGHHALPASSEFTPDPDNNLSPSMRGQPGMAERAGLRPLVGAVPAFFRHSNRSSEPSVPPSERGFTRVSGRKLPSQFSAGMTAGPGSPPPNMPLAAPGARTPDQEYERNLSSHSFYRDSEGFYGGEGYSASQNPNAYTGPGAATNVQDFTGHSPSPSESLENPNAARGPTPEEIALSPGPQRTPTVHRGGPYTMSPSSTVPSTPLVPVTPRSPGFGAADSPGVASSGVGAGSGIARSETPTTDRGSRFTEEV